MKFLKKTIIIFWVCCAVLFNFSCSAKNPKNSFTFFGTPSYGLSPLIDTQTVLGGSKKDFVGEILAHNDYIYVLGETQSNDGTFTSSSGGHKLFLSVLNNKGQFLKCMVFGISKIKNTFLKAKIINDFMYILSDCTLETESVAVYKINPQTDSIQHTVTGSLLTDENGLDLIEWKDSIFVIGQSYDYITSCKSLFITRLDQKLNQKHYERIIRPADLTYIGTENSSDCLKVWVNAIAITYSYPAMIDISKDNYIYNNFQNELLTFRLLNVSTINNKALLILCNEDRNNTAAYVFYSLKGFEKINYIAIDNITNAKVIADKDYALVYLFGKISAYYIITKDMYFPQNNLNKNITTPNKSLKVNFGALMLTQNNNKYELIFFYRQKIKIIELTSIDNINALCVYQDYLITASDYKAKKSQDIKVYFSKIMPYYFN